jgi:hypothetical protein
MSADSATAPQGNGSGKAATAGANPDSDSDSEHEKLKLCAYCNKVPPVFMTVPCKHWVACKPCAMKKATGGKCKVCGVLFASWERAY